MSSPYTPPHAEDPVVVTRGSGNGFRVVTRILGGVAFLAAAGLAVLLGKFGSMARELGSFDRLPLRTLSALLFGCGGLLPFIGAALLAGAGIFLSFRKGAGALPMLVLVLASLLLTVASYFGMWLLVAEIVRMTGGP